MVKIKRDFRFDFIEIQIETGERFQILEDSCQGKAFLDYLVVSHELEDRKFRKNYIVDTYKEI